MRARAIQLLFLCSVAACDEPSEGADAAPAPRSPSRPDPSPVPPGERVESGRIYVPMYSHVYTRSGETQDLAVTVSIHNVSVERSLVLESVRYYDTRGKLLEEFVDEASMLEPLETVEFFVPTDDARGGSGANVVVTWGADAPMVAPLVEAVMVQWGQTNRAFAFTTRGLEVSREGTLPDEQSEVKRTETGGKRASQTVVELPGTAADLSGAPIAISLSTAGLTVDGDATEFSALRAKMDELAGSTPDATVTITAEDAVAHGQLVEVLDVLEAAGFSRIAFAKRSQD